MQMKAAVQHWHLAHCTRSVDEVFDCLVAIVELRFVIVSIEL
jgi:hypothetical protein